MFFCVCAVTVVPVRGPFKVGQYLHLMVLCIRGTTCGYHWIEVEATNATQAKIRVGNNTYVDSSGHCPGCACTDLETCQRGFDAKTDKCQHGLPCYYITLELPSDSDIVTYLAYVKVHGSNIRSGFHRSTNHKSSSP